VKAKLLLAFGGLLGISWLSGFQSGRPDSLQQATFMSPHHLLAVWLQHEPQALQTFASLRIDRVGVFNNSGLALAVALQALLMLWCLRRP